MVVSGHGLAPSLGLAITQHGWSLHVILYLTNVIWLWCKLLNLNSLWPSDPMWRPCSGLTLAQVMACCLTAPSHYLNQCWLIVREIQWHSSDLRAISWEIPSHRGHWWRWLQPTSSIITDAKSVYSNLYNFAMQGWHRLNRGADIITGLSRRHPCRFSKGYIS